MLFKPEYDKKRKKQATEKAVKKFLKKIYAARQKKRLKMQKL